MKLAQVVVDKASPAYDKPYDYLLPDSIPARAGCRVLVPFGAGSRSRIAMVLEIREGEAPARAKAVAALLDPEPLLSEEGLWLLRLLHDTTFCGWFDAVRALVVPGAGMKIELGLTPVRGLAPEALALLSSDARRLYEILCARRGAVLEQRAIAAAGLSSDAPALAELLERGLAKREQLVRKRIVDERAVMVRLLEGYGEHPHTEKQQKIVELLEQVGCASVRELCYFTGVTRAVVDRMRKSGMVELYEELTPRRASSRTAGPTDTEPIRLSPSQQAAFDLLLEVGRSPKAEVSLLHGVTGSGKTQVFLRLIEETLSRGRTALVLIPEISLTPQTVSKFSARFGSLVAVLHSSLSMTERFDEWQRIRSGAARIVVGTRSAVMAPLENIGLIVIDEEQEHTYHSESAPRYHARDIAKHRAVRHRAHLLLCSATPSIESYYYALSGKYHLACLPERYSGNLLPEVLTVDMKTAPLAAGSQTLSEELCEQLRETFERREQAILLLNRRGYHTLVKCSSCGEVYRCPNCSIPLTYHAANRRMICHYCGHSVPADAPCPSCKSAMLRQTGVGTQRVEEELHALFPDARILRMDMDTTMSRFAHERGFGAFSRGEYDLMIGTQMVAKGLDFPNVTLVGVLAADQSLYAEDFRGYERTFSLITQVVGRCGRGDKPGRAVIQTFDPENRVLTLAAAQDYPAFYQEEIGYRRVGLYPPFCDIACAVFSSAEEAEAVRAARDYASRFAELAREQYSGLPLRLLGPAECSPYRVAGRYRCRLLVKCRSDRSTRSLFASLFEWYYAQRFAAVLTLDFYYDSNV